MSDRWMLVPSRWSRSNPIRFATWNGIDQFICIWKLMFIDFCLFDAGCFSFVHILRFVKLLVSFYGVLVDMGTFFWFLLVHYIPVTVFLDLNQVAFDSALFCYWTNFIFGYRNWADHQFLPFFNRWKLTCLHLLIIRPTSLHPGFRS